MRVNLIPSLLLALLAALWSLGTLAAASPPDGNTVKLALLAERAAIVPGQPFTLAIRQTIKPGWHTYWRNPGDSGEPMQLDWSLPEGFVASEILWPVPERIAVGPLMNYGYSNEAIFLVEITPPEVLFDDRVTLSADAHWLSCAEICIPEEGSVTLSLPVAGAGGLAAPTEEAAAIAQARQALPRPLPWTVSLVVEADIAILRVAAKGLNGSGGADIHFLPHQWGVIDHAAEQSVSVDADGLTLRLTRGDLKHESLSEFSGLLVIAEEVGGQRLRQAFTVQAAANAAASPANSAAPATTVEIGLWQALLFAVLGGLILNLMPCVFPVLSLKALALARAEASQHRIQGLAYGGGVLASFAVLAALLVILREAGLAAGWGFQFQSPLFVMVMAMVFLALGLSLSGVFVIGGGAIGLGAELATRGGATGSFFTGVLATIVATPCTAPFMGVALGYALSQPAAHTVAVLMALGLGLAAPLTVLSFLPGLSRLLPRPGAWMETFKQVMAFPLYASAAWLVWVLSLQAGSEGVLAAMVGLTLTGLAAWLFGRGQTTRGRFGPAAAAAVTVVALAVPYGLLADAPVPGQSEPAMASNGEPGDAIAYRPERLAALKAEGRPVFINLTAAWCITCKVNEQVALNAPSVSEAMARKGVVYMKGDWTNQDPDISALLKQYGRAGVPLYLLIAPGLDGGERVLPQILTEAMLIEAFEALPDADPRRTAGQPEFSRTPPSVKGDA